MALKPLIINDGNVVEDVMQSKEDRFLSSDTTQHGGSESFVLHRSLHHEPLQVISAKGNLIHLNNGQSIFDATGGAAVSCLGHGNERYPSPSDDESV